MPRRARVSLPGVSLHLIQRGNNRSACFYADEDYVFYLDILVEQAKKYGCAIHAWCLMTNHVHLLVTPESPASAGLMMKGLGQRYVLRQMETTHWVAQGLLPKWRPRWDEES